MGIEPWVEHSDVWKTKSAFFSWLRGCIRRSVWMRYPPKIKFKNSMCSGKIPVGYVGKARSGGMCSLTGKWAPKSMLEVDHITGTGSLNNWNDVEGFVKHLCADSKNMQLVEKEAHKIKSYADRAGISYNDAVLEKEVIRLLKKENIKEADSLLKQFTSCGGSRRDRIREAVKQSHKEKAL